MPGKETKAAAKKPKARGAGIAMDGENAILQLEQLQPDGTGDDAALVYFLYGKERYLVDRAIALLRDRLVDPRTRDFNYELYQGKDTKADRIVNALRTLPMMAKRRVVLVRDFDSMKADEQAKLVPYLEDPSPEAALVLESDKLDSRTRFGASVKKYATVIKLDPLYERQLIGFVRAEAKRRKLTLETGAGELLCEEIGADLGALADTVERLALFVAARVASGGGGAVTAQDVEAQVPGGRQRTVFELADAVGKGDRARALAILSTMMDGKESGVRVVAMLARHVRQLWSADGLMRARTPRAELASALGVPPFFVDGIVDQARRVAKGGEAAFRALHESLVRADRELKSSRLEEARIMERLVLEMTSAARAHRPATGSGGSGDEPGRRA